MDKKGQELINQLSSRLNLIAESRKQNLKQLSLDCGFSYSTFQRYTSSNSMPKADLFVGLHDIGINLHWFATGEGKMYRATPEQNSVLQQQINGKDANNVVAGNTVNNGNLVATVVNNEGQGREMRLCQFVHEFLINADDDDCLWFELQLSRCFPEYKAWKQENSG